MHVHVNETKQLDTARLSNAKEYWKMVKGSTNINSKCALSSSDFLKYFKAIHDPDSVFYQPDEDVVFSNDRHLDDDQDVMLSELNVPFYVDEIVNACKKLNSGKSAGSDYWLNELFRYGSCCYGFVNVLCVLLNKLFDLRYFPADWSEGFIVPLHKKGDTDDVGNYRGITLLSTFGKLFSEVLNDRLHVWAEKYHVYIETHAGFRQHMGTVNNMFCILWSYNTLT